MKQHNLYKVILITGFLLFSIGSNAIERVGRLGVGMSNQLKTDIPAISFKLQKSKSTAFSLLGGIDTDESSGGWGVGAKLFRNIFEEPQLNFYGAVMGALINKKINQSQSNSGFQFDLTMGSEFSFTGLSSIGFSFEFGVSLNKLEEFRVQTVGDSFIVAAAHFYL